MRYCPNCGNDLIVNANYCSSCGASFQMEGSERVDDRPNGGFAVLGFFIPLVGLILYLVWMNDYPLKAKSCGKGALFGVISYLVIVFLYILLIISLVFA